MFRSVLGTVALSASLFLPSAEAQQRVEQHMTAVGGVEMLAALKSMQRSGRVDIDSAAGRWSGLFQEAYDLENDRGFVALTTAELSQRTGWIGERGWKDSSLEGLSDMDAGELVSCPRNAYPIARPLSLAAFVTPRRQISQYACLAAPWQRTK